MYIQKTFSFIAIVESKCSFCVRKTKYRCTLCVNAVCVVCSVACNVDDEGYDEHHRVGKCLPGLCHKLLEDESESTDPEVSTSTANTISTFPVICNFSTILIYYYLQR